MKYVSLECLLVAVLLVVVIADNCYAWGPSQVTISKPLFPETILWTHQTGFISGCSGACEDFVTAKIADDGVIRPHIREPRLLGDYMIVCGIRIFEPLNRISVCAGNLTVALGAYTTGVQAICLEADLTTGKVLAVYDMSNIGGPVFVNDVVYDYLGNKFYSDSIGGRILTVRNGGRSASVFIKDERLLPPPGAFLGANGIAFQHGYLVVGNQGSNRLFKTSTLFPDLRNVSADINTLNSDGAIFGPSGLLYVVNNISPQASVFVYKSTDNFASATLIGNGTSKYEKGSAVALRQGSVYMTHSAYPFANSSVIDKVEIQYTMIP